MNWRDRRECTEKLFAKVCRSTRAKCDDGAPADGCAACGMRSGRGVDRSMRNPGGGRMARPGLKPVFGGAAGIWPQGRPAGAFCRIGWPWASHCREASVCYIAFSFPRANPYGRPSRRSLHARLDGYQPASTGLCGVPDLREMVDGLLPADHGLPGHIPDPRLRVGGWG